MTLCKTKACLTRKAGTPKGDRPVDDIEEVEEADPFGLDQFLAFWL